MLELVSASTKLTSGSQPLISRQVRQRSGEKDFAPRLVHQPEDAQVQPNVPHTVECPVEARPLAEVSWFKDEQPLVSRPPQQEQTGGELMFFQMSEEDGGQYRCQASNYLGKVSSERFMLTVQTSRDPKIRFEPRLAEVESDKQVRFTCTIPASGRRQRRGSAGPEVSWRRNGRPLQVKWLEENEELAEARARFVGQRVSPSDFVLTITRVQLKDHNATFSCLYTNDQEHSSLARESDPVSLIVYQQPTQLTSSTPFPPSKELEGSATNNRVPIEVNLGQPIDNLANTKDPSLLAHSNQHHHGHNINQTTQLIEPRRISSLRETLSDLYEMAKPTLMILLIVFIVCTFLILQLIYLRKRTRQNRYMKHQYSGGSSGTSSALGGSSIDCGHPVLHGLMGRTLSAPSAMSLAAASKKYRSYRDHMRKIAAANDLVGNDLADNYFAAAAVAAAASGAGSQQVTTDREPFFGPTVLPNLYNQSLAAREQHRTLLQANEHMRSLSSLSHQSQSIQQSLKQQALRLGGLNGSHLNLPLSFAFGNNIPTDQQATLMHNGSLWPSHLAQFSAAGARNHQQQQQQQQLLQLSNNHQLNLQQQPHLQSVSSQRQLNSQQDNEHYQLVNCSSLSPSSSSSIVESANSGAQVRLDQVDHHSQGGPINHYSTIDTNEEEEDCYEELDHRAGPIKRSASQVKTNSSQIKQDNYTRGSNRTSTFVIGVESQQQHQVDSNTQQKSSLRPSVISSSNSSSSGCGDSTMTSSSVASGDTFSRFGSKRSGRNQQQTTKSGLHKRQTSCQDRLSPYAVSSVCSSIVQPPPVNSEAMKALHEQFDINQLMLLDEPPKQTLPLTDTQATPPPPPPPPPNRSPNSSDMDKYQEKRRPRRDPS